MPDDRRRDAEGERVPVEAWPVGHYIEEEMQARGWTSADVAVRMGGKTSRERGIDMLIVEAIIAIDDPRMRIDETTAKKLAQAFDVSAKFFLNLQQTWIAYCARSPGIEVERERDG